ncbi:hypothetical protein PVAND_016257 [Polypedilum vanderplanki]|uniref:Uncharacterized protein n=1 Tax=Polypedilum vanderplanki TaxID=319348 RepID=A0A9J6BFB1_POLVA|nr:hypothetical protein PVAND_016257 [Polypedilum vanderplanki]
MLVVWKMITKCYQDYLNGKNRSEIKDDVGISVFCDYLENFVNNFNFGTDLDEKYQKIYFSQCLVMLLQIVQLNDLDDEVGKERLQKLLKTILLSYDISEFAIEEISHVIEKVIPNC